MPLYEYVCEEDGTRVTALRSMSDADKPLEDPDGKNRTFKRVHSTFSVGATSPSTASSVPASCGCGGSCACSG